MIYGYARVSTVDQDPTLQVSALESAGCVGVVTEHASGGKRDRPELLALLERLKAGDSVVVWKLDRLSRSLVDLLWILERIKKAGAGFRSVTEAIDTTTPAGRMMMQMLGAFAEFERSMIRERTLAGLEAARARGSHLGRRAKLTPAQKRHACELLEQGRSQRAVAGLLGVGKSTISRVWRAHISGQGFRDTAARVRPFR
ncbi:MAG: DNA invertase Pin-like site-specific DNA recombinase [Myxococcota bacterium]|jgi:DNA invertase Pin-like site-specific DNA recombinase